MRQSGDGCLSTSTLCRYERSRGDLFVQSWSRVPLGSAVFDACAIGGDLFMTLLCILFFRYISTDIVCMDLMLVSLDACYV